MGEWEEKVDAAYDMVHALCQPRGSKGSREWIMSIPARPDYDPDLVITSGLKAAAKHIHAITDERDRLSAENAKLESELSAEVAENVRLRTREVGDEVGNLLQEVADLKNELARVKAESLRVVADPRGDEWVMTPDGLGWYGADAIGNPCIETLHGYYDSDRCKHVRLERWDANDDHS